MTLRIEPHVAKEDGSDVVRSCSIIREVDGRLVSSSDLWFRFDRSIPRPADQDCDAYLLCLIMQAMRDQEDIRVQGCVDEELLSNLVEYQYAWNRWLPDLYHLVEIHADSVALSQARSREAICAFSGGVDATFSVWRHAQRQCSYRSQIIKSGILVHGFDIPLSDSKAFDRRFESAEKTLADLDLDIYRLRTNQRDVCDVNWTHSHSCALVGAMSNFKEIAGTCIVPSSYPYDSLVIPYGSSPITDYLLSSSTFSVMHDGASHGRTEKVEEICNWAEGVNNLVVCWEGKLEEGNCGKCEKCVRTRLNFLATGNPEPACFPPSDILSDLRRVALSGSVELAEWQPLYERARCKNLDARLLKAIARVIASRSRSPLRNVIRQMADRVLPSSSRRREVMKRLATKLQSGR